MVHKLHSLQDPRELLVLFSWLFCVLTWNVFLHVSSQKASSKWQLHRGEAGCHCSNVISRVFQNSSEWNWKVKWSSTQQTVTDLSVPVSSCQFLYNITVEAVLFASPCSTSIASASANLINCLTSASFAQSGVVCRAALRCWMLNQKWFESHAQLKHLRTTNYQIDGDDVTWRRKFGIWSTIAVPKFIKTCCIFDGSCRSKRYFDTVRPCWILLNMANFADDLMQ